MNYQDLINTISEIVDNEKINKIGMTLLYELPENEHNLINREIFNKINPYSTKFEETDEFEVMLGGILVKFKKNK